MINNKSGTVNIESDGSKYFGEYSVTKNMITVTTRHDSKTTQLGGTPPEVLAKIILAELVREGKASGSI